MKNHSKLLQLAVTALILSSSGMAHALSTTATSATFNLTKTQTDTTVNNGNGATTSANSTLGGTQPSFAKFDTSTGVLTGATVSLNSNRTVTVNGSGNKNSTTSTNRTASFDATIANNGSTFTAPNTTGATSTFSSITTPATTCTLNGTTTNCTASGTSGAQATNATRTVSGASLSNYTGAGSVSATLASSLSADVTNSTGNNLSSGTANAALEWSGTVGATYTYSNHANASFIANDTSAAGNALTLDFGNLTLGSSATQGFSIFNAASSSVGLDLTNAGAGANGTFSSGITGLFSNLGSGANNAFTAGFTATGLGLLSQVYTLTFGDNTSGAGVGFLSGETLTLTLKGTGISAVPVPAAVWLMGSAMAGLFSFRKRKATLAA